MIEVVVDIGVASGPLPTTIYYNV